MICICDVETTGLDPKTASIIEIGVVVIPGFETFSTLVKPDHAIEMPAMAAHHITEEELVDAPPFKEAIASSMIGSADFIAAHNSEFDSGFLKINKPWICTYRCARHLYPDAPGHSNQVLRYYLKLNEIVKSTPQGKVIMQLPPHRALPDAWVTAHILEVMLKDKTPQELVELSTAPILIKKVNFGKHRGMDWGDVPKSYLRWVIGQDFDSDSIHTAKHHLGVV